MIIDWQYAMSELSRKNGVDVEEEIRKAREKLNDEMAQREKKLAEEQKLLEEKMVQEILRVVMGEWTRLEVWAY